MNPFLTELNAIRKFSMLALEERNRSYEQLGQNFSRFGRSQISLPNRRMRRLALTSCWTDVRQQIRESCDTVPGVYGMVDGSGELIYVGYSAKLKNRLLTYFSNSALDRKEGRIARRAVRLVWEEVKHDFAAQLRELELIRRFQPLMNRQGKSIRDKSAYLCLSSDLAAGVRIENHRPARGCLTWGPLQTGRRLIEAVRDLNLSFGLADYSRLLPLGGSAESESMPQSIRCRDLSRESCLSTETAICPASCQDFWTTQEYDVRVALAADFLNGQTPRLLKKLETQMALHSKNLEFFSAARVRDRWLALRYLDRELALLREPVLHELVYTPQVGRYTYWFLIRHSMVQWAGKAPRTPAQAEAVLDLLHYSPASPYGVESDRDLQRIVNRWMSQFSDEGPQCLTIDAAAKKCLELVRRV